MPTHHEHAAPSLEDVIKSGQALLNAIQPHSKKSGSGFAYSGAKPSMAHAADPMSFFDRLNSLVFEMEEKLLNAPEKLTETYCKRVYKEASHFVKTCVEYLAHKIYSIKPMICQALANTCPEVLDLMSSLFNKLNPEAKQKATTTQKAAPQKTATTRKKKR